MGLRRERQRHRAKSFGFVEMSAEGGRTKTYRPPSAPLYECDQVPLAV